MRHSFFLTLLALAACQGGDGDGPDSTPTPSDTTLQATAATGTVSTDCSYPAGAVEPMAQDEVLTAYHWPEARHMDGLRTASLELEHVPCDSDDDIDWSPHDVLVFVSIPAW